MADRKKEATLSEKPSRQKNPPTPLQVAKTSSEEAPKEPTSEGRVAALKGVLRPPLRKDAGGSGTLGRRIALSSNHFAVKLSKSTIYHYDFDIKPAPSKTLFKKVAGQFLKSDPRLKNIRPVFDGMKNIFTSSPIPGLNSQVEIEFPFLEMLDEKRQKETRFKVYLQPTGSLEVDLNALETYCRGHGTSIDIPFYPIQALDVVMKFGAAQRKTNILVNNCLVSIPTSGRAINLGGGLEVWSGHFQSLRLGWRPFLNVDVTHSVFVKSGKVHEIMADMCKSRIGESLSDRQYQEFGKKIASLKVSYSRGSYIAKVGCNGLKGPANREEFDCDGRKSTIQEYFEKKYKLKLRYPSLPCVWVGDRKKRVLVPMELCTIAEGQEYRKKLSDFHLAEVVKLTSTPANIRKQKIIDAVRDMDFKSDEFSRQFGISIDSQMTKVQGRVLPTPKLVYGRSESQVIIPNDGVWNMTNMKLVEPKTLNCFGVINMTHCTDRDISNFLGVLTKAGSEMGMTIGQCSFLRHVYAPDLEKTMIMAKQKYPQLQIIFVVIQKRGDPAYEIVKRVGDINLGVTTQCIQHKNITGKHGPDRSTVANVCLKLNAKLGGINNLIARDCRPRVLLKEQVIIMGADVTHPGADQHNSNKPSIAAVVGSVDPRASQYCCEIRIQRSKQEHIEDMEDMVYNLLRKFNRVAGSTSTGKPQRIIFYRDGVSEGQFAKVLEWELSAIRKACTRLENGYQPPVTLVVVQKRHHTRLFPEDPRDECGRGKNVPPGTIVDSTIVHPVEQDFFLVSHQGIQGTSRPTHYHVLWDDSKFSADELQMLTYYMCYLFTRCTRSVSYPAPCYYSHLVAYRGRQYYDSLIGKRAISNVELQKHIDSTRDLSFMFFI